MLSEYEYKTELIEKGIQLAQGKNKSELRDINPLNKRSFSVAKLKKYIKTGKDKDVEICNYQDLFRFFSEISPINFINKDILNDTFFECLFYENNYAWVSKDEIGIHRYFSKSTNNVVVSFNLVDLIEIHYNKNTFRALDTAVRELGVHFMEGEWINSQSKKYLYNFTTIHKFNNLQYSSELLRALKPHLKIIESINVIGSINIKKKNFSYKDESIFFVSNSYLSAFMADMSQSKINKVLNYLTLLGIINKISKDNIPGQLFYVSTQNANMNKHNNHISFYTIPSMDVSLKIAEQRIKILNQNKIKYSNLSKGRVEQIFGEDFTNQIYAQKTSNQDIEGSKDKVYLVVDIIKETLIKSKFVTKDDIIVLAKSINISKNFIVQNWQLIVNISGFKYYKVSKSEMLKLNLLKQSYILSNME